MSSSPTMSLSDMMQQGLGEQEPPLYDQPTQPGQGQFGSGRTPGDDEVINAAGPEHGAAILNAHREMQEAKADVQDAQLAYFGKAAEAIQAANYDPFVADVLLQHAAGEPELADHANQLRALVQQNPQALKPIVDNVIESAKSGSGQGTQGQGNNDGVGAEQEPGGNNQDAAPATNGQGRQNPSPGPGGSDAVVDMTEQQKAASRIPRPGSAQGSGGSRKPSPGRPPRLYAVVYTQGNRGEGGDKDFRNAAFTRADDIRHSPDFDPQKDNVWVYAVQTKDDFKNVAENLGKYEKQFGKVEQLALFSHGGKDYGPIFHIQDPQKGWMQDQFKRDEFSHLNINFSKTATADLMMCHTAEPQNGYAQAFADAQGVPTRGFGDTVFSADPGNKVRGYGEGGPEYLLGSGGNWFQRNILGYPPQPPHVFYRGGGGRGGGGGAAW